MTRKLPDKIHYGRLTIIGLSSRTDHKRTFWTCECFCGTIKAVKESNLKDGLTRSCGCLRSMSYSTTHGHAGHGKVSRAYMAWQHMIRRCYSSRTYNYHNYGGRDIKVCMRWRESFEEFLHDMGEPEKGMSLDRKDNNSNYTPDNCRWATNSEQQRNTRTNRMLTFRGKTQCLFAWAEEIQIHPRTLWARLDSGWSIKQALITPVRSVRKGGLS